MMRMQLVVEYFHYCQTVTEELMDIWTEQKCMFLETEVTC